MRNLTAAALAKIAEPLGSEPVYIIGIQWVDGGGIKYYADRRIDTEGVTGMILQAGDLDAVITSSSESQSVSITLDDTSGEIKSTMDAHDIHKRDAWVYQWFEGLDIDDKILMFKGKVNSPLSWSEGEQSVSLTIVSQIEDMELGFSPEEGEFDFISNELIGQPWPLCFGTCVYSKGLQLTDPAIGTTADGVAMADPAIAARIAALEIQITLFQNSESAHRTNAALALLHGDEDLKLEEERLANDNRASWERRQTEVTELEAKYNPQLATELSSFRMFNADRFPEGQVSIRIGQLYLEGYKSGDSFIITSRTHPKLVEDPEAQLPYCDGYYSVFSYAYEGIHYRGPDDGHPAWRPLPYTKGDHTWGYIYEKPNTKVYLRTAEPVKYIVSLVPGTVKNVSAMVQNEGQKFLSNIGEDQWTQSTENFGPISAVVIEIPDALSKQDTSGYSDELYITFESSVGPNTVDILEWVIQNYTEFSIDTTSFDHVRTRLENYPSHFSVQERFNVLDFLNEVAWQARCQLRLVNGEFYLTYLPEVPASVATITESDIDVGSFEIEYTPTENLTTKMVCNWWATGAQDVPNRTILRHNVSKYGIQENTYDFFIYNDIDLVLKSATFWLIRYANTWKVARFTTPLNLLNVETQDGVTLSFTTAYVSNSPIIALVDEATYDSEGHKIQFQCWTGVKAGQMEQYDFAYPADVDTTKTFPTPEEIAAGLDGGWGNNKKATGELGTEALESRVHRVEYVINDPDGFFSTKRRFNDRGDPTPSDLGNNSPGDPILDVPPILQIAAPAPDSGVIDDPVLPIVDPAETPDTGLTRINLHTTLIYDDETQKSAPLSTFFNKISTAVGKEEDVLHARTDATWSNEVETEGVEFLFQYDTDIGAFGAGLAFLYDDSGS